MIQWNISKVDLLALKIEPANYMTDPDSRP